jgi:segregation and condensation protein B
VSGTRDTDPDKSESRPLDTERPPSEAPSSGTTTDPPSEPTTLTGQPAAVPWTGDTEQTVNLTGEAFKDLPIRDDLQPTPWEDEHASTGEHEAAPDVLMTEMPAALPEEAGDVARTHLKGLLESLVFVSDKPIKSGELARAASAPVKQVRELLAELRGEYTSRGIQLEEIAGGWIFRTNPAYAPFVRDLTKHKPVRLTRAQVETLAILAYRQPITRPEVDEIRGVDCGATLKLLLERDLVRILGKKDEPGRPLLYGTTHAFLEFFGLKSLKDLPTLREFTELNEDSRRVVEQELGEVLDARQPEEGEGEAAPPTQSEGEGGLAETADGAAEERDAPADVEQSSSTEPGEEPSPVVRDTVPPAPPSAEDTMDSTKG